MMKFLATTTMTILMATGAQAQDAKVAPVVEDAIKNLVAMNKPATGKTGCAKAAGVGGARGTNHVTLKDPIREGNDKPQCDDYISDSGQLGEKGREIEKVFNDPKIGAAYVKHFLSDDALFGKEGGKGEEGADNHGGVIRFCPGFEQKMGTQDRMKVLVKFLAVLANERTGCTGVSKKPSQYTKEGKGGDFDIPYKAEVHKKFGTWAGNGRHCSADNVADARGNVLCALDMLGDQLALKQDSKGNRGVIHEQAFWEQLRDDKQVEKIEKQFENFSLCKSQ